MGKFEGYLIGTDYDGTLNLGGVSERNLEMISRFRREGGRFGVVTGRCYTDTCFGIMKDLEGYCDFAVSMNGAAGILADGTVIFETPEDPSVLEPLYKGLRMFEGVCYIGCATKKNIYSLGEAGEEEKTPVSDILSGGNFYQVNVICSSSELADRVCDMIHERFPDKLNPLRNGTIVDIPAYGISKASGVRACAEYFKIPEENIFTVGDNYNDIDMISAFNGCAVENAVDRAKAVAKCVVPDVAGVIEYIERTRAL